MGFFKFLTSKSFVLQLIIALAVIVIFSFGLLKYLNFTTNHGETINVPNLKKKSVNKAETILNDLELNLFVLDTVQYRPDMPPYSIVEQDPSAESEVELGRKIYVKINSGGYSDVTLPEFEDKTYRQLLANILSLGLKEGEITYQPHFAKDIIIALKQNGKTLKKGDKIKKNSPIDFVLGDGKESYNSMPEEQSDSLNTEITTDPLLDD